MKKLLVSTSAAAIMLGLGFAPAFANPMVKNAYDVYDLVDIYTEDIYDNDDVVIESYNIAVMSENDLWGEVYDNWLDVDEYVETGDIYVYDDVQENAAGQFAQAFDTGIFNVNQAAASIAANADITFESD